MKGIIVSDFNAENFAAYLRNGEHSGVSAAVVPYGPVRPILMNRQAENWTDEADFAVIWSRPESVLEGFAAALSGAEAQESRVCDEVDDFASCILAAKDRAKVIFVPTWVLPPLHGGSGLGELSRNGIERLLMAANLRLLERLDGERNIHALNTQKWIQSAGAKAFDSRLWYLAKIPYAHDVFKEAARSVRAALHGLAGRSRKLIILDLDDTLWGGIVGDVGWEQLRLGGHDPVGESLLDFQRELKALSRRGIILGVVSKNEEATALTAIDQHPEMVLRRDDFAGWRINWEDKAANVAALARQLNLGLDATVFIDDNPVERARVRDVLPDVLVPEWPADPRLYCQALHQLNCFDQPAVTVEDRQRTLMYTSERQRSELKADAISVDNWLHQLAIVVAVEELGPTNVTRAAQLLNKTNQFNLSTRRLTEAELLGWAEGPGRKFWAFRVADRYGDSGLTGLLSLEYAEGEARIQDFVLSCRVFGRKVDDAMLHLATSWCRRHELRRLTAVFQPTAKNKPCLEFLVRAGFQELPDLKFAWDLSAESRLPQQISMVSNLGETKSTAGSGAAV